MSAVAAALDAVDDEKARARVIRWAAERYEVSLAPARKQQHIDRAGGNARGETPEELADLSDLVSAAAPSTDEDRALVVAYWVQDLQEEKQPDVSGNEVNRELKNLGHGVKDISKVFTSLMGTSPQQVIQTKKSGSSRQARKRYKVTAAGKTRVRTLVADTPD